MLIAKWIIRLKGQCLRITFLLLLTSSLVAAQQNRFSLRTDPYIKVSRDICFRKNDILLNAEIRPIDRKFAPNLTVTYHRASENGPDYVRSWIESKYRYFAVGINWTFLQYASLNQKLRINSALGMNSHVIRGIVLYEDSTIIFPNQVGASLSLLTCMSFKIHSKFSVFTSAEYFYRKEFYQFDGEKKRYEAYFRSQYLFGLIYWFKKQGEKKAE